MSIATAMETRLKKDPAKNLSPFVNMLVLLVVVFIKRSALMTQSTAALLQAQVQLQQQLHVILFAWGKMMVLLYLKAAL